MTILTRWAGGQSNRGDETKQAATGGEDRSPGTVPAAASEATVRQVLDGLGAPRPVVWVPHQDVWYRRLTRGCASALAWPVRRLLRADGSVYAALGLVALLLIGVGGWVLESRKGEMVPTLVAAATSTAIAPARLDQIAQSFRAPLLAEGVEEKAPPARAPLLITGALTEVDAGHPTRLPVEVKNLDTAEPETVALINGLPEAAHLSEGIMIGPGLWMLRPELVGSVEVDTRDAMPGEHELTLELRTASGSMVAEARTTLAIRAPVVHEVATTPEQIVEPTARPHEAAKNVHSRRAVHLPVARHLAKPKPDVAITRPAATHREARRAVKRANIAPIAAASPPKPIVIQQAAAPPRLVWPGDKPDGSYQASPPVFLGGAIPLADVVPQVNSAPQPPQGWHKRAFRNPSGN